MSTVIYLANQQIQVITGTPGNFELPLYSNLLTHSAIGTYDRF